MRHLIFILFLSIMTGLSSCDSTPPVIPAKGAPYEVVVVMDNEIWKSHTGDMIKEALNAPVPYLPQEESSMKYSYTRIEQPQSYLMLLRNVLVVSVDKSQHTKVSLQKDLNVWANNQAVLYLNAPDVNMLEEYLTENKGILVNYFTKEEMRRAGDLLSNSYSQRVMNDVIDKFGITISVPEDITSSKHGEDCL